MKVIWKEGLSPRDCKLLVAGHVCDPSDSTKHNRGKQRDGAQLTPFGTHQT